MFNLYSLMESKLRIAIVANANSIHTVRWVNGLKNKGHIVKVFSLNNHDTASYFGPEPPLDRRYFLTLGNNVRKTTTLLQSMINDFKPNLVHGFFLTNHGMYASRIKKFPIIVTAMGSDVLLAPNESKLLSWIVKNVVKRANMIVVVSEALSKNIVSWGIDSSKIVVSPLGIDVKSFKSLNKEKSVLFSRGFKEVYDPLTLVKAIPYVISKRPDIKFILCGDGPLREQCISYLSKKKMINFVEFPGYVSNEVLSTITGNALVMVSPSLSDGTPVSLLEGLASGCALVTSDIPANRFWTIKNKTGLMFDKGNSKHLGEVLVNVLNDNSLLKNVLREGPKLVKENADWDSEISKIERMYYNIIQ